IGACVALLNGVDAIVVIGERDARVRDFAVDLIKQLQKPLSKARASSCIHLYFLGYSF
ncbi:MAG: hypothetical protein HQL13_03365, partial [Candidatus Omnitrophica bacterium]|nr:hypothetical protein [Candidatus Omnitrophota bacterium]